MRDAVRANEVAAGPARNDRDLDAGPRCDSVDDLVDGAVPPDGDEQLGAVFRRLPCELRQLAGPLGEERVAGEPGGRCAICNLRPASAGRAVV